MSTARWSAPIALLAIWLLTHRYFGIQHDGIFYGVQALARIEPTAYRHDIFFALGSQDDFSLFSRLYASLISSIGLNHAAFWLLVSAHLAWALAAFALAHQFIKGRALWIGLALLFSLPGHYGSQAESAHDVLRYAESFLTARSWAEPLALAGVAATLSEHRRLALVAIALAFVCHPIMALPGAFFLATYHARPGPIAIGLGIAAATVIAFLLPEMDAPWFAEVRHRVKYVLLDTWTWGELLEPFAWIGILLAASAQGRDRQRLALRSLALAGATGFYLAALGTVSHAALLIQAQPWRCLWLLKVAALLALVTMFAERWHRSAADRWLVAGLAAAALTAQTLGGPVALALAVLARRAWCGDRAPAIPRWLPTAGYIALAVTLLETMLAILQQLGILGQRVAELLGGSSVMPKGDFAAFLQGPLALLLPIGVALLLCLQSRRPRLALTFAVLAAGTATIGWYRANDVVQEFVYSTPNTRPFGQAIGQSETVFWQGNLLYTWFVLRQSSYASTEQGASALFSRQAAMETARRQQRLDAFNVPEGAAAPQFAQMTALHELCRDPALDVVILPQPIAGLTATAWFDPLRQAPWSLYRCADLRSARAPTDRAGA